MREIWQGIMGGYAPNWRIHLGLAGLVCLAGGVAALWTLLVFEPQVRAHFTAPGFVAVAMTGAGLAGLLLGPFMGRRGVGFAMLSLIAFFGATVFGALLSGGIGLGGGAIDLAMLWLVMHFASPALALWLALWGAVHWAGLWLRQRFT